MQASSRFPISHMQSVRPRNEPFIPRRTFLRGVGVTLALPFLEAMRPSLAMSPSLSPEETMRLINTLSAVLSERVQMEHKLAQLRPTWGRARDDLNELAAILKPGVR